MTLNLFDLTYRTAREIGILTEGTATGGSATTLIDTVGLASDAEHYWKGGAIWLLYDAAGAGASPQGKYAIITAFASDTDTVTFTPTMTDAIASGDRYALGKPLYPLHTIIQAVNRALNEIRIPVTDTTSIDTEANKSEYTLPIAANIDLRQVFMQNRLNDANDNQWSELLNWTVQRSAAGTADTLVFPYQLASGYDIKIVYAAAPSAMYTYTDKLIDLVDWRVVVYRAAFYLLLDNQMRTGKEDIITRSNIERMDRRAAEAAATYPISIPRRPSQVMIPEA
jgi:hypothetical protein